jgi:holo-[acyl-carrier protein] synthase
LIGLGHDLQLISELRDATALREPGVFFTSEELSRFGSAADPLESLGGGFAAKEALFKALPALPSGQTWFWTDAELLHDRRGAPRFRTHGSLAGHLARHRMSVDVSISHSGGFVSAVVVISGGRTALTRVLGAFDRMVRRVLR